MALSCAPQSVLANSAVYASVADRDLQIAKVHLWCRFSVRPILDIAGSSTNGNTQLVWTTPGTADSWQIWRSINGGALVQIGTVAGNVLTFTDTGALAAGDEWDYQVRSVKAGKAGTFSIPAGVVNNLISNPAANATLSFPNVVVAYTNFGFTAGNTHVLGFLAPRLHDIGLVTPMSLGTGPNLSSLDLTGLIHGGQLTIASDPLLASINLPNAITLGFLELSISTNRKSILCPKLVSINGHLDIFTSPNLTQLSFPSLTTLTLDLDCNGDTSLPSLPFPVLASIGGSIAAYNCTNLSLVSFPVLQTMPNAGSFIDFSGDPALTNLSFPALTNPPGIGITAGLNGNAGIASANLQTVSIPNVLFRAATGVIDFQGCALNVSSINQILRRAALSLPGMNACAITLQGGTNAAPTGQGVADKAALIAGGNTVTTN